jgi:hypothetical protein
VAVSYSVLLYISEVLAFINVSIVTYLLMLKMRHSYQNFCAASVPKSFALQVLKSKEV